VWVRVPYDRRGQGLRLHGLSETMSAIKTKVPLPPPRLGDPGNGQGNALFADDGVLIADQQTIRTARLTTKAARRHDAGLGRAATPVVIAHVVRLGLSGQWHVMLRGLDGV
jgi:hypothetical protein